MTEEKNTETKTEEDEANDISPSKIKKRLFFKKYVEHVSTLTDAPKKYHEVIALFLLSAVLQRNLRMQFRHKAIYPNLWVVLLGLSSITRRTTAMLLGMNLLPKELKILPHKFSPEALIAALGENPRTVFYRDEFGGFLADLTKRYMSGMKEEFCMLYECPERHETFLKKEGRRLLEKIYLCILTATTIAMYQRNINQDDISSGFCARFLYVLVEDKHGWKGLGYGGEGEEKSRQHLAQLLQEIYEKMGLRKEPIDLQFDAKALRVYNKWLRKHEKKLFDEENMEEMSSFYTRIADYVIKISMLLWAEEHVNSSIRNSEKLSYIDTKTVKKAIQMGEGFLNEARTVVQKITESTNERILRKLLNQLKKHGELDHSTWLKNANMKAKDFQEYQSTLLQRGEVVFDKERNVYRYVDKGEVKKDEQQPTAGLQGA